MGSTVSGPAVRAFEIWAAVALVALLPVTLALDGSFPIFTVVWVLVPVIVVLRTKDATRIGFRSVPTSLLLQTTAINLGLFFALMLAFEPWSHTYERLLEFVVSTQPLDTTFAWLVRLPRPPALAAMAVYSGLVTLFGEELFFRGWLLQALRSRTGTASAIILQACRDTEHPGGLCAAASRGHPVRRRVRMVDNRHCWRLGGGTYGQHLAEPRDRDRGQPGAGWPAPVERLGEGIADIAPRQ